MDVWGVVAQLVERRPRDPMGSMGRGSNPVRTARGHIRAKQKALIAQVNVFVFCTPFCGPYGKFSPQESQLQQSRATHP